MMRPPIASLKTALALLLAALLLSAAGLLWSRGEAQTAQQALDTQQATLRAAQGRQQQGESEARLIRQHLDAYQSLAARGFIGAENRLAWIEAVQLANRDARLYGLTYTLSPRAAATADLSGGLPLQQTRMTVKLPLLVETDLPRFLAAVRARAPGIFRVASCQVQRVSDVRTQALDRPELDAECELLWFTIATGEGS